MDFLIDGQISLFCPDKHEGELLKFGHSEKATKFEKNLPLIDVTE